MTNDRKLPRLPRPYTTLGRFVDRCQQIDVFTRDQLLAYGRACTEAERKRLTDTDSARNFPTNTCSSSRHADQIAERWRRGVAEEPEEYEHSADSVQATVRALWEARTAIERLRSDIEGYVTVNAELMTAIEEVRADATRMQYLLSLSTLSADLFQWNGSPKRADEIRVDIDNEMRARKR